MQRRAFIAGLLIAGMGAARAQSGKIYRIAVVHPADAVTSMSETGSANFRAFFAGLRARGYVEGQNLLVDRRSGEGRTDNYDALAQGVVQSNPDVIFVSSVRLVRELKKYTTKIPIVGFMSDPVAYGLVASLARPGANVTGISSDAGVELQQKRLELLKEAVPSVSTVAYLTPRRVWEDVGGKLMREAASRSGLALIAAPLDAPIQEDAYRRAFDQMTLAKAEALVVGDAPENYSNRATIIALAQKQNLPAIFPYADAGEDGALLTYGIDRKDVYRRAADYVHQILQGANPGDLPVYLPTKFALSVNLKTAKALGVKLTDGFLARVDDAIE